ncbi:MAG: hypothetical protein ACP5RD_02440 [bacterium]
MNKIIINSLYPRSEELIKKTRDFDRNRINENELEEYFNIDFLEFLNLQNQLNFYYYYNGMFKFKDLLRPFTLILKNSYANTLIRFEETNTFWRKLEISHFDIFYDNFEIIFNKYLNLDYLIKNISFSNSKKILITLPSIFTFYKYSNLNFEQINLLLTEFIKNLLSYLNSNNFNYKENLSIILVEYLDFSYNKDLELFEENFRYLNNLINQLNKENLELFYFTYSNLKNIMLKLFSLDFKGISINFYKNNIEDIDFNKLNKLLLAGVIYTESSLLETEDKIHSFINKINKYFDLNNIIFTIDFIPYLLPRNIMDNKIKNLANILNKQKLTTKN